jgi:hypothetical protein
MDAQSKMVIAAYLVKLATAYGQTLNTARIEIYLEDLAEFTQAQVLTAITWARKNLGRFPTIADLRIQIEGSDEDHANNAWEALLRMIYTTPVCFFRLHDPVMVKTITKTWVDWHRTRQAFAQPLDEIATAAMKRAWKIAYIENYKHRDELFQDMHSLTILEDPLPAQAEDYAYTKTDYLVDSDYNLVLQGHRTIHPAPERERPMTPEVKAKLQELLERLEGKGGQFDWYYQEFPRRSKTVNPYVIRKYGDLPNDDRLWDPITGEARLATLAIPDVSNDGAPGCRLRHGRESSIYMEDGSAGDRLGLTRPNMKGRDQGING